MAQFGLFVELDDFIVEGLVHITWLPDYFIFYPERFCLLGQHTGQTYRLGGRVRVRVNNVSHEYGNVDEACEAESLGGLEVNDQLELYGLFHGQVTRLGAFEDLIHVEIRRKQRIKDVP